MRLDPDEDDAGVKLIRRLQACYYGQWSELFSGRPDPWGLDACYRIAALTGGAEIVFIDGQAWSKHQADVPGRIFAYTDAVMITATITGVAEPQNSGCTVQAISRSNLHAVRIPETSWFDRTPVDEWPAVGRVIADYGTSQVTLPAATSPTNSLLTSLARFIPSLLADLPGVRRS